MKKIIALLLAVLTLLSMTSAAFTDEAKIGESYLEAVAAMSEKGVVGGFLDGTFQPLGTLTRAQAAKIICVMLFGQENVGSIPAKATGFTDVPENHWASAFVSYCAEKGIVAGVGSGKFDPNGKLTGLAFGQMLLTAYGHKAEAEGLTGTGWDTNTLNLLKKEGRTIGVEVSSKEMSRQEACQLAYNFTFPAADITNYAETSVSLKTETSLYKTYGRTYLGEKGVNLDMAGNAIEFEVECMGDISMTCDAEMTSYFQCFVDGEKALRPCVTSGKDRKVLVARNVQPGTHTIRILRDTNASKTGQRMELTGITFTGVKSTMKATPAKDLYIEFLGDSITAGKYTEMQYGEGDAIHAGSNSYAYLTAQALNADWSMVCRGGCGYFRVSSCPKTMNQLYPYYNGFKKNPVEYTPTRKADVVVIALGTNDSSSSVKESYENGTVPFATFEDAVKDLIKQVRAKNGSDVKIVLQYGMMTGSWASELKAVAEETGCYSLKVTRNNDGGSSSSTSTGHPSAEGHAKNAEELTKFLRETVLK